MRPAVIDPAASSVAAGVDYFDHVIAPAEPGDARAEHAGSLATLVATVPG